MISHQIVVNLNASSSSKFNRTLIACYAAMRYLPSMRYSPIYTIKRYSSTFTIKRYSSIYTIKRYSPIFTIKRYSPIYTIKRYSPIFTIKRYSSISHYYIFVDRRIYLIILFLIYLVDRFDYLLDNSSGIIITNFVLLITLLKIIYSWLYAKTLKCRYRSTCYSN